MCYVSAKNSSINPVKITEPKNQVKNSQGNTDNDKDIKPFNNDISKITKKPSSETEPVFGFVTNMSASAVSSNKEKKGLKIEIIDKNGFNDIAPANVNDISIKANGKLKISKDSLINAINTATGTVVDTTLGSDSKIGKASFDKKSKSYNIPINGFFDDIKLNLKSENNKLVIRVKNQQLAGFTDVLGSIESRIKNAGLPFKIVKHEIEYTDGNLVIDPRIELVPDFKGKSLSKSIDLKSNNISEKNTTVNFDEEGNLNLELKNVEMQGKEVNPKASEKSSGDEDRVSITIDEEIKIGTPKAHNTLGDVQVNISDGSANIELDPKESNFNLNELNFGKQFSTSKVKVDNIHAEITLKSDKSYELKPTQPKPHKEKSFFDSVISPVSGTIKEAVEKLYPPKYENKTTSVSVKNVGADVSLDLQGPGREVKMTGKLEADVKNEKTDFGNPNRKDTDKTKVDLKFKNVTETKFQYPDGSTEGNKSNMEMDAGIDEKGNITFNPIVLATNAIINNSSNKVSTSTNELIIGGPAALDKLKEKAEKAKESIHIESFLFNGKPADDLSEILVRKASEGVKVKLIIDSSFGELKDTKGAVITKDNEKDFNRGSLALTKAKEAFIKKINEDKTISPPKKKQLIDNVDKNLDWRLLQNGMLRIDHRKIWIVGGKESISGGGVNLTQSAIVGSKNDDGSINPPKHDSMYEIHGPVVRQLQQGFIDFWNKNSEKPLDEKETKQLLKN